MNGTGEDVKPSVIETPCDLCRHDAARLKFEWQHQGWPRWLRRIIWWAIGGRT